MRLFDEAYDVLSRVFASGLSITQKPRVSSDPLHKDRHTYPQTFSVIVHDSAIIIAEPVLIPNVQPKVVGFCSGNSSRLNLGSQGGVFFFFQQISLFLFWM